MSRGTKRFLGLAVVLVIALIVFGLVASGGEEPTMVYTSPAERLTELKAVVTASGEIQPRDSVDIQAEIPGVIIELPVKEGDIVQKGQVLLRIDPVATEADTAAVRAGLQQAQAQRSGQDVLLMKAQANLLSDEAALKAAELEKVQTDANCRRALDALERRQKLFEQQLLSADDLEIAKNTAEVATAACDAAAARVAQYQALLEANRIALDQFQSLRESAARGVEAAQANLDKAEDTLKKTTILSPLSGIITRLNVEVGERAVPGVLNSPQATLMTISDMSVIEAEIKVDETDVVQVSVGDEAEIEVDALPNRKLRGTVCEIANSPLFVSSSGASQTAEVKDFLVKLRVIDPSPELRPGLSCSADITTEVRANPLVVPIQSLTARDLLLDEAGQPKVPTLEDIDREKAAEAAPAEAATAAVPLREKTEAVEGVFVRGPGDRALFRPIKVGIAGQTDYEVLEGLEGGEEIVSGPYRVLRTLEIGDALMVDNSRQFRAAGDRAESD
jgi:HlyD family secretion protein